MQYEENDSVSFGKLEQQNTGKNDLERNRLFPPPPTVRSPLLRSPLSTTEGVKKGISRQVSWAGFLFQTKVALQVKDKRI